MQKTNKSSDYSGHRMTKGLSQIMKGCELGSISKYESKIGMVSRHERLGIRGDFKTDDLHRKYLKVSKT